MLALAGEAGSARSEARTVSRARDPNSLGERPKYLIVL